MRAVPDPMRSDPMCRRRRRARAVPAAAGRARGHHLASPSSPRSTRSRSAPCRRPRRPAISRILSSNDACSSISLSLRLHLLQPRVHHLKPRADARRLLSMSARDMPEGAPPPARPRARGGRPRWAPRARWRRGGGAAAASGGGRFRPRPRARRPRPPGVGLLGAFLPHPTKTADDCACPSVCPSYMDAPTPPSSPDSSGVGWRLAGARGGRGGGGRGGPRAAAGAAAAGAAARAAAAAPGAPSRGDAHLRHCLARLLAAPVGLDLERRLRLVLVAARGEGGVDLLLAILVLGVLPRGRPATRAFCARRSISASSRTRSRLERLPPAGPRDARPVRCAACRRFASTSASARASASSSACARRRPRRSLALALATRTFSSFFRSSSLALLVLRLHRLLLRLGHLAALLLLVLREDGALVTGLARSALPPRRPPPIASASAFQTRRCRPRACARRARARRVLRARAESRRAASPRPEADAARGDALARLAAAREALDLDGGELLATLLLDPSIRARARPPRASSSTCAAISACLRAASSTSASAAAALAASLVRSACPPWRAQAPFAAGS